LSYDGENRLTSVSGYATATFVYDGDGKRVKGTIGNVTTYYIGNSYEYSTQQSGITPVQVTPLNSGVACQDGATGSGYLLYSAESVHERFADNPPFSTNADHFICVKYISGQWNYDDNVAYHVFTPEEGDILVASINYDTDVITSQAGQNSTTYGIARGYASGNLGYVADQYGGAANDGEFTVTGSSFTPNKLVIARKYYTAGGTRVAMREAGTLYFLLSDHLGGTNVTVDREGEEFGEVRYKAFGDTRYTSGTTPTTMRYTGQRQESTIGLYYYGARWYDAYLNRWIQPDSIIPDPGNPLDFDRFAYARNNPLVNIDPSGHRPCTADEAASGDETCEQNYPVEDIDYIIHRVLMGIFKLAEPRPELDIETVPGFPAGWLDILIRGANVVANILNSFTKQDLKPTVFVWLTYNEYDDGTVSIPGLTINNDSDQTVYLNWVKFTTYNEEEIFRPSTIGFDGDYLATIPSGVSGWVPFYKGVPTPTITPPPTFAWSLTVTISSNFMVNVNNYWAYPLLQYTIFPRY
jgi:RHS repeat-associated protein